MRRRCARLAVAIAVVALAFSTGTAKAIAYLNYSDIAARITALAADNPSLVRVETAQSLFGLPAVGYCAGKPCETYVVTLTNLTSLAADPARAEVLVSGEVHGDEVIGPNAVLAYVEMVVRRVRDKDPYFVRMINSRAVTLLPMSNAVGFATGVRGEKQSGIEEVIDPNRDFAFDQDPKKCMQTVTGRAINELFRAHLFRVLVTFHGGTNVIGYEWGDMTHCTGRDCKLAPDDAFMRALGNRMSTYAGAAATFSPQYPVGTMGALVYPVHGGMEDWAYGASWAPEAVHCAPETLGGYDADRTVYGPGTHRCATYLVETANNKRPAESELGDDEGMLVGGGFGDGHVPRNVRLLVSAVDAAEPYLVVDRNVNATASDAIFSWSVGGAFLVDGTHLQWSGADGVSYGTSEVVNGTAGLVDVDSTSVATVFVSPALPVTSDKLYVRAAAVVDAQLEIVPPGAVPNVGPMTHLVGARRNASWQFTNGDRKVQGARVFYSETVVAVRDASGQVSVQLEPEITWSSVSGKGPRAPTGTVTLSILDSQSQGVPLPRAATVPPTSSSADGIGADDIGTHAVDPRDQHALLSGIFGIVSLIVVTFVIVTYIVRFHQAKRDDEDDTEDVEPLQPNGSAEKLPQDEEDVLSVNV